MIILNEEEVKSLKSYNYLVVDANKLSKLTATVEDLISQGWRVQGGICAYFDIAKHSAVYLQAMVKYVQI